MEPLYFVWTLSLDSSNVRLDKWRLCTPLWQILSTVPNPPDQVHTLRCCPALLSSSYHVTRPLTQPRVLIGRQLGSCDALLSMTIHVCSHVTQDASAVFMGVLGSAWVDSSLKGSVVASVETVLPVHTQCWHLYGQRFLTPFVMIYYVFFCTSDCIHSTKETFQSLDVSVHAHGTWQYNFTFVYFPVPLVSKLGVWDRLRRPRSAISKYPFIYFVIFLISFYLFTRDLFMFIIVLS